MAKICKGPTLEVNNITDPTVIPRLMKVVMVRVSPIDKLFTSTVEV